MVRGWLKQKRPRMAKASINPKCEAGQSTPGLTKTKGRKGCPGTSLDCENTCPLRLKWLRKPNLRNLSWDHHRLAQGETRPFDIRNLSLGYTQQSLQIPGIFSQTQLVQAAIFGLRLEFAGQIPTYSYENPMCPNIQLFNCSSQNPIICCLSKRTSSKQKKTGKLLLKHRWTGRVASCFGFAGFADFADFAAPAFVGGLQTSDDWQKDCRIYGKT